MALGPGPAGLKFWAPPVPWVPSIDDAWNTNDKSGNVVLSDADKTGTVTTATSGAVRSTKVHTNGVAGKFYAEFVLTNGNSPRVGIQPVSGTLTTTATSAHFQCGVGNINVLGTILTTTAPASAGDIICVAWDTGAELIWFRTNSGTWNNNGSADPATGTGGFDASGFASTDHALWFTSGTLGTAVTIRTEFADLTLSVPSGFTSWMAETAATLFAADAGSYALTGTAAGLTILGDTVNLPAGANWFNPWGPKQPVQDWKFSNQCLFGIVVTPPDTTNLPAGGANWFNPWGPRQPERSWRHPGIQLVPVVLVAASGSYTLTGTAATVAFGQVAGSGSYSVTGSSVALALGHVAGAGSYTLTGTAAGLTVAVNYAAAAGSYTITGSAATFAFGHAAGAGTYTLTGSAASLVIPGVVDYLPAGLTGGYVPWGRPYPVDLRTSTGRVPPPVPVILTAAGGSYTITGSSATFAFGHVAGSGNYALTGSAAGLVIPGAVTYLPAGMTGGYVPWRRPYPISLLTRTGRPLATAVPVTLTAAAGSYTITGSAAGLTVATPADTTNLPAGGANWFNPWGRPYPTALLSWASQPILAGPTTLPAAAGNYIITGSSALLTVASPPDTTNLPAGGTNWFNPWGRRYPTSLLTRTGRPLAVGPLTLAAAAGSYTTTGSSAALALRLTANSGSYTVSGSAAVLARGFAAGAGAYAILGTDAQLVQAGTITLTCGVGSYTLTGSDVSFIGITPPVEVTPPSTGAGAGVRVGRYKQFKLKKKRKHDQCEELLEYLRSLPPAEAEAAVAELPPRYLSLLDGLPLPHALVLPPAQTDDDDDDACALLLELLLR